jgi:predicted metal-binding protein
MSDRRANPTSGLAIAQPGADVDADLGRIAEGVLEHRAARSCVISSGNIAVREDPQAHGQGCRCAPGNLMDPPFAPSPLEFRPWLDGFSSALVVQVDHPVEGFEQGEPAWACRLKSMREEAGYAELHDAWESLHAAVMWTERELFRHGYYLSVGFGALTCTLCQTCDVTKLCKFPYRARPSVEAVGIDVGATLQRSGLDRDGILTGIVLAV